MAFRKPHSLKLRHFTVYIFKWPHYNFLVFTNDGDSNMIDVVRITKFSLLGFMVVMAVAIAVI